MRRSVRLLKLPSAGMLKPVPLIAVASTIVLVFFLATLVPLEKSPTPADTSAFPLVGPRSVPVTEATALHRLPRFLREEGFADNWDGEYSCSGRASKVSTPAAAATNQS